MLLVNTRTSGSASSASINEIDPRGGAAITGDNAVGKTTTLELFPLFFGTLPSQITETVGGREPMLKFVLPMAQSAIVFEYQRGSDETHDVRCAVLRRTDNDHRPVFRLINGGFREEAFLRTNDEGELTFCDDRQTAQAYEAMGVQVSQLLDIADYRAVILGMEARTQDAKKLRVLSTVYGFGSRLTNLDRLIAAVAKERVDFKDFVRLAITIVQERLSSNGDAPSRQRVTLRQSKEQIQRWLRDRHALELAFSMTKDVELLREACKEHTQSETDLRTARLRIAPALMLRRDQLGANSRFLSKTISDQSEHAADGQDRYQTLNDTASVAANAMLAAKTSVTAEEARRGSLSLDAVHSWSAAVERIPQLQDDQATVKAQIESHSGKADKIISNYKDLIHNASQMATKAAAKLRDGKDAVRIRWSADSTRLTELHQQRVREVDEELDGQSGEIGFQLDNVIEAKATLKAQINSAQASAATQEALELARSAVEVSQGQQTETLRVAGQAALKSQTATRAFLDAEGVVARAQTRVIECEMQVRDAQARISPADGTLLSVLRASSGDDWKSSLAKILDPALLQRSDLDPVRLSGEESETVYGWQLRTQGIEAPAWADDQQMRDALIQAQKTLVAALDKLRAAEDAQAAAAKSEKESAEASLLAEAESTAATSRLSARKSVMESAKLASELEIKALKVDGQSHFDKLDHRFKELTNQINAAKNAHKGTKERLRSELQSDLKENERALAVEIAGIEEEAVIVEKRGEDSAARLGEELDLELKSAGVDPQRLKELNKRAEDFYREIESAESRRPTVNLWRAWLSEGGDQILASLIEQHRLAEKESRRAMEELGQHNRDFKSKQNELSVEVERLEKIGKRMDQEILDLAGLLKGHGLPEITTREADPDVSVEDIKGDLGRAQLMVEQRYDLVTRRASPIRDALTGTTSAVSEFVQSHLDSMPDGVSRIRVAEELCILHKELGRQVLPNVINEASVILQQVRQFRGVITRFEAEVKRFNAELQKGLSVAHFKRIDDFKVAIVSNFSDLDLIKEVDEIERVARDHEANIRVSDVPQLPDANTAGALTKFLALLRSDSTVELDLASHVALRGSVTVNGETRHFSREADLEHISSTGINAIILISLLVGMLNMVRGKADLYIPWISDEVGKFDAGNFKGLMDTLRENRIDPVTASPKLTPAEFRHFERRYLFRDRGAIGLFAPAARRGKSGSVDGRVGATVGFEGADHET
ncbi:ATP-binding protein [Hydrogenophaga sp. PAMC20947]|uniref:ATP-binding protein n=1 Tax=Hydrogenophaga sp. PAMC20947 TaxID=2565558 RepID=UPI001446BEFB|nr:ATP-binding protein [Hydrogenophaga sp. PAMC20947]